MDEGFNILKKELIIIQKELKAGFVSVTSELRSTNGCIDTTNNLIDETNKKVEETSKRIDETNKRVDETNRKLEATNHELRSFKKKWVKSLMELEATCVDGIEKRFGT